ncbi:hypothetical protein SAMN05421538_11339 [Paracoccus isoporae]|uniref:DnaA protein n=1 Tax=Paracoccus isoporae TaxID=591205 RepID=A0A1G7GG78_9RHOB|nr:chromosomal replication initiator DnaA [Paracoccus isoporae]SDE87134.1 hypothetical protein SAMN05421538_11339 [Paracoccus isoporae]
MARQLTLDLPHETALGRDDFLVTDANRTAVATLDAPDLWPQGRMLLIGPEGSGKTHLAAIWAADHGAAHVDAAALTADEADPLARAGGAVIVEDAHRVAGVPAAEAALFHLWNLCAARGCRLLLTARGPARDWALSLPDLQSRMAALPLTRIEAPDEALLAAVLVKLFADRQISASSGLISWLVPRMDRDLGLARRLVGALDMAALAAGKAPTRQMAADILHRLSEN